MKLNKMLLNKRGQIAFDLIVMIIILFIALVFFAGWTFMTHSLSTTLRGIGVMGNGINMTQISDSTLGQYDSSLSMLQYLALAIFFGSVLSIFVHNYLIKVSPFFFAVYFILSVVAVIFSAIMSNAYMTLLKVPALSTLYTYTMMNYIMMYLPIIISAVCFIGLILLFVNYDAGQGGGIGI